MEISRRPQPKEWEFVCTENEDTEITMTDRLDVPNGWVYRVRTWDNAGNLLSACICHVGEGG